MKITEAWDWTGQRGRASFRSEPDSGEGKVSGVNRARFRSEPDSGGGGGGEFQE